MQFEVGVVIITGASFTRVGLRRDGFFVVLARRSIVAVIPAVLLLMLRLCVLDAACIFAGTNWLVVLVTGGASPTLYL